MFDTGRDGTVLIGAEFVRKFNLWDIFETLFSLRKKKVVINPTVKLGNLTFHDIVTNVRNPKYPYGTQSLLGNEILNHFNVILDNPNGILYLKPNTLQQGQYATYAEFKIQASLLAASAFVVIIILIWLFRNWARSRKKSNKSEMLKRNYF